MQQFGWTVCHLFGLYGRAGESEIATQFSTSTLCSESFDDLSYIFLDSCGTIVVDEPIWSLGSCFDGWCIGTCFWIRPYGLAPFVFFINYNEKVVATVLTQTSLECYIF
mmetsp:Transcript_22157/g.32725  ORF Transcript_22157/g.32725 Transcript_22157/m.32725 type:complete len:109 (-) Transcript_22157:1352-1678(-)